MRRNLGRLRLLLAAAAVVCLGAAGARAQNTWTVDTLNDDSTTLSATAQTNCGSGNSGTCALRDAILAAGSGDTIVFETGLTGTISLGSALPNIAQSMTITGPGANLITISGSGISGGRPIVFISNIGGETVSISGLTFAGGNANSGGALEIQTAAVTVSNCTFSGNSATAMQGGGAIYTTSSLTVIDSTFSGNSANATSAGGGAIASSGLLLTVINSTFAANSAQIGGAIALENNLELTNSTFSGNTATVQGGGAIFIYAASGSNLNNNIFSGNTAASGSDGGGAVWNVGGGTTNASNNVYWDNFAGGSESDCQGCSSNANATSASSNPLALPLGNYGGKMETMALAPGSAAICAGSASLAVDQNSNPLTTDQRGFALDASCPSSSNVDAGAVQTNQYVVTTLADATDASPACATGTGTTCSLRDAIGLANASPGDVTFSSTLTFPGTITLGTNAGTGDIPLPAIAGLMNIFGPGANQLTVSGNNDTNVGSVLTVNSGGTAMLYGLTIANGNMRTLPGGGGINNHGTLTVLASAISGNQASNGLAAGGILNDGTLTLTGSTISGNTSGDGGGGIFNGGTLTVTESTVSGNSDIDPTNSGEGGGIDSSGTLTLTGSTVSGNSASCNTCAGASTGGGIYIAGGTLTASNSVVAGNTTEGIAGGGDCAGCGTQSSSNLIGGTPELSALQYNGINATLQTMIPLPGSPAICAGSTSLIPSGTTTDERGFPLQPTGGYCTPGTLDAGAVQTYYTSLSFLQQPSDVAVGATMSPAPTMQVVETDTLLSSSNTDAVNVAGLTVNSSNFTLTDLESELASGFSESATGGSIELDGLTFSAAASTDTLTGTLTVTGSSTIQGTSNSFNVFAPLSFSSPNSLNWDVNLALNFSVTTTGGDGTVTLAVSNVANPIPGVTVPTFGTGSITLTGTPTAAGTETFTITATDSDGNTDTQNFTLSVNPAVIFTSAASTTDTVGTALNFNVSTSGGTGAVTLAVSNIQNAIPGVTVPASGTGTITLSGTPTATGTETFTTTATDSIGGISAQNFTLTVNPPPNYVVNTANDSYATGQPSNCPANPTTPTGPGSCELRDALAASAAVAGTITFDSAAFPSPTTIALAYGTLAIPAYTAINGPASGGTITVQGGTSGLSGSGGGGGPPPPPPQPQPVFSLASGLTASIANLTITGGNAGGIANNGGTLTVTGSAINNNTTSLSTPPSGGNQGGGGGIFSSSGALTVINTTISGNQTLSGGTYPAEGGGVNVGGGTATISNSTITGNSSFDDGGGIYVAGGTVTITTSTITGNTSPTNYGGGIYNSGGSLTITNSTISGNTAPLSNGGGINNSSGTITLANTIVAGNTAQSDPDAEGAFTSGGYNLIGDGTGTSGLTNGTNFDQVGSEPSSTINPQVATLGNYGGPTQTMVPLPGSPAICAGSLPGVPPGATTDQRGFPLQPTAGYCSGTVDIGAVQSNYTSLAFVQQPTDVASGTSMTTAPTLQATETDTLNSNTDIVNLTGLTVPPPSFTLTDSSHLLQTGYTEAASNVLSLNGLTFSGAAMGDTLTAGLTVTGPTTLSATSNTFNVIGPLAQFAVSAPGPVTAGNTFSVTPTAEDSAGNVITSYSGNAAVSIASGPGTFTAGSMLSVTCANGVCTFSNLVLDTAGTYTITASGSVATGTSGSFTVNAGPPATITANGGTPQSATVNTPFTSPLVALVTDLYNNPVPNASVTFTAPGSGDSGTFSNSTDTITNNTDVTGQVSESFTANTVAGSGYSVTASVSGVKLAATFTLTNTPGPAAGFTFSYPSYFENAPDAFVGWPVFVTVTAVDQYGNLVPGYPGTVTVTSTDPAAVLPPNSTLPGGSNTFQATLNTPNATGWTFTVTDVSNTSVTGTTGLIPVAAPAAFVVNTPNDTADPITNCGNPSVGPCSLRDALSASYAATAGTITFDSTAVPSGTTIKLNPVYGPLDIPNDTSITGPYTGVGMTLADGITISGGLSTNVFTMGDQNAQGIIDGIGITDGAMIDLSGFDGVGGPAIDNDGTLTVMHSVISNNLAISAAFTLGGAIFTDNDLEISDSVVSNNLAAGGVVFGGAIENESYMNATNIIVSGNEADGTTEEGLSAGGGIDTSCADITGSTISGNSALGPADGTGNAFGGGISAEACSTLTRSTVSGNQAVAGGQAAGGGIAVDIDGDVHIRRSTISANTADDAGGDYNTGLESFSNSILADNTATATPFNDLDDQGTTNDRGGNLIAVSGIGLAPLGNNGGPTQTMLPIPGSLAICNGAPALIPLDQTTDQRGFPNTNTMYPGFTSGPACVDSGAVQSNYALSFSTEPGPTQFSGVAFPAAVALSESGMPFTAAPETITLALEGGSVASFTGKSAVTSAGVATYSLKLTNPSAVSGLQLGATLTGGLAAPATSSAFDLDERTPAALTSPTPGTTLAGPKVTFTWGGIPTATAYKLWIGTTFGSNNVYTSGTITTTSATASLPVNGETLYVTLVTVYGPTQAYNRYTFTAASQAALTSPTPGSVLDGSSVTFTWSAASLSSEYKLWIGTTYGSDNLYTSGPITTTSASPTNLPTNGQTIYVTLVTVNGASQLYNHYTFTEASQAALISPVPGSVLAGPKVTFTWSSSPGATAYKLWIGTTSGSNNLYSSGPVTTTSAKPANLPTNGETVYVTLVTIKGSNQFLNHYTFTAETLAAALTSPVQGTVLAGSTVTFNWGAAPGSTAYKLWIGTSAGKNDLYTSGPVTTTSATPTNLPTNGKTVYVTLVTDYGATQVYNRYTFTATTPAALTSPTPGAVLSGPRVTFNWSAAPAATGYNLLIGTAVGKGDLYTSGLISARSATPANLPTDGETLYVTVLTVYGASQLSNHYTFTAEQLAALISPTPSSALTGSSVTFTWSTAPGASDYKLWIGTTFGSNNIYSSGPTANTFATPTNLPTNGETVYVTVVTVKGSTQLSNHYTFTAESLAAALISPTPGTTLSGAKVPFTWGGAPQATGYKLWVGSSFGKNDIYTSGTVTTTTATTTNLPTNGETVYVTVVTIYGSAQVYNRYTFTTGP